MALDIWYCLFQESSNSFLSQGLIEFQPFGDCWQLIQLPFVFYLLAWCWCFFKLNCFPILNPLGSSGCSQRFYFWYWMQDLWLHFHSSYGWLFGQSTIMSISLWSGFPLAFFWCWICLVSPIWDVQSLLRWQYWFTIFCHCGHTILLAIPFFMELQLWSLE